MLFRRTSRVLLRPMLAPWLAVAAACSSGSGVDAGPDVSCDIEVTLGTGNRMSFAPLADGDPLEVWLGFQGFLMLDLAVRLTGAPATAADLTVHLTVESTDVHVDQVDRQMPALAVDDGSTMVEDYLIFFNDVPASRLIGHTARIEQIARAGGCMGTQRIEVELRDDNRCVNTSIVIPDAGVSDGGLPDGAVACEDLP
jgi:hypothetical protein